MKTLSSLVLNSVICTLESIDQTPQALLLPMWVKKKKSNNYIRDKPESFNFKHSWLRQSVGWKAK